MGPIKSKEVHDFLLSFELAQPPSSASNTDKKENKIFFIYYEIQRDRVQNHI